VKKIYELKEVKDGKEIHIGYVRASSMSVIADYFLYEIPKRKILIYPITNFKIDKSKIKTIYNKRKR